MAAPLQYLLLTVKVVSLISKILRLVLKTLRVEEKDYLLARENLTQPNQMQLSEKQKTFLEYLFAFSKSILNFKHLPKKDEPHS